MGLWTLLEGFLLIANALAILNEDRFLAPRGWSFSEFSVGGTKSLKTNRKTLLTPARRGALAHWGLPFTDKLASQFNCSPESPLYMLKTVNTIEFRFGADSSNY